MINAKKIESQQRVRYGDFYETWEIKTDEETREDVIAYCLEQLVNHKPYKDSDDSLLPESSEWHENIKSGGSRSGDMAYYFRGYWKLKKTDSGYLFTKVRPYAD